MAYFGPMMQRSALGATTRQQKRVVCSTRHTRRAARTCTVQPLAAVLPISSTSTKVRMATLPTCQLAVSWYPMFAYKAQDGGGEGTVQDLGDGRLKLTFDPAGLNIPALNWRTASIFGVPIPPPLNIAINPQRLEGTLDTKSGVMELSFLARFEFTAGSLYSAPPLIVETVLTTEHSEGEIRKADGTRLGEDGSTRLVGVARVPRVDDPNDWWTNIFLMLPTDALAVMDAKFSFE